MPNSSSKSLSKKMQPQVNSKHPSVSDKQPPVSLLTITQHSRFPCIQNLYDLIKRQTYTNISEWIIVEGSPSLDLAEQNRGQITDFINSIMNNRLTNKMSMTITITYLDYSPDLALSDLRNKGNLACTGDIIVCMDDDDYYPKERVTHAVHQLQNSTKLIAGCSKAYMYDYFLDKMYKFKEFGPNHSTNNCLAYKREYLEKHSHSPGLRSGEEMSFTNGFREPMIQLSARKTIVISSHDKNTYNKREMCEASNLGQNPMLRLVSGSPLNELNEYIPLEIYDRLKGIFTRELRNGGDNNMNII